MLSPFTLRRSLRRIIGFRHEYHWFVVVRALQQRVLAGRRMPAVNQRSFGAEMQLGAAEVNPLRPCAAMELESSLMES
jgi:hypothetical protein